MRAFQRSFNAILAFLIIFTTVHSYPQPDFGRATSETDRFMNKDKEMERWMQKIPQKPVIETDQDIVGESRFFIKKVNLVGCRKLSPDTFTEILAKYENREIVPSELKALATLIENEYASRGMEAVVLVPLGQPKEETLTLQVLEDGQ